MKNSSDLTIRYSEKSIFPILTTESYIQPKASHLKGVPSYCRHQRFVYLLLKCSSDGSTLHIVLSKLSSLCFSSSYISTICANDGYKHDAGEGILTISQKA